MSIFDSLPKPEERVKAMLRRDLSSRVERDREAGRWKGNGYFYMGGADLLLQHGEFWTGRPAPEEYHHLRGEMGTCFLTHLLAAEADSRLTYVEGYCTSGAEYPFAHGWCVDKDGVVDLTSVEPTEEPYAYSSRTMMPYLSRERWGYYGVRFRSELVRSHVDDHHWPLPMLDRSGAEKVAHSDDPDSYGETHDFPILKLNYDPQRTTFP